MEVNPNLTEKGIRDYRLVMKAVNNGDQKAYAELMKHYRDSLYFMLLKMTNNPNDADDLTIEAFGKAFKNLRQYTPDYAFSTWLFKIASNNCIDFIRRKKKHTFSMNEGYSDEDDELANKLPSQSPDPEEKVIKKQKIKLMRDVVEKLKPHYRKLIELRYFKEYSYEEIAKELDLPLGTVKAQLFRAREFLYNILKNAQEKL
ncbi:MAG: sigma-70 family RNA polymerase sigma factor [Bacteroidales bacterium]|nr:sigma-70 family RNA polymerase sigma factor [Bacteroidales bacterium]MCF8387680.1 sigma-70 family RNA polymerase sigma factor [Bacteroidales bacterium]MCF8398769.1 sigma-70 family RNA polymerase sigma factor [Bacteroidales bacterium]